MMHHTKCMTLSIVLTLCALFNNFNCMSVETLSNEHNVTKRNSEPSDFYPDWVPFKNKNGDELGEFTEVTSKRILKKRLAHPANFRFSEGGGDDYYDKSGGDGEDYFEKRDWSDLHRTPAHSTSEPVLIQDDLVDIDGLVITVNTTTELTPAVHISSESTKSQENASSVSDLSKVETNFETIPPRTQNNQTKRSSKAKNESVKKSSKKYEDEIEYEDGFSSQTKKKDPEIIDDEVRVASGEQRHKILDLVDDLKEQHEAEQRVISEKMKEEELSREEHDLNYGNNRFDKYAGVTLQRKLPLNFDEYDELGPDEDKYKLPRQISKSSSETSSILPVTTTAATTKKVQKKNQVVESGKLSFFRNPSLFMVYDDDKDSEELLDSIPPVRNLKSTEVTPTGSLTTAKTTNTLEISTTTTQKPSSHYVYTSPWSHHVSQQESSIFSPNLTETPERKTERISLVPISPNLDVNEPALFFPKPRKVKSKNKESTSHWSTSSRTETSQLDNFGTTGPSAEQRVISNRSPLISDKYQATGISAGANSTDTFSIEPTALVDTVTNSIKNIKREPEPFSTKKSNVKIMNNKVIHRGDNTEHVFPSSVVIAPSAGDSVPSAADTAPSAVASNLDKSLEMDAVSASSDAKEKGHEPQNHEHESAGSHQHEAEHEEEHGEHGKKAYEGFHKDSKSGKGHHNKEDHLGKYHDHGGFDKHHHDESGHHGEHHHEEHGKKHAQYEESGKHSKGHSTKGSHDIHKKEEYEKNVEFFEEEGDSEEEEKHGGFHKDKEHKKGGSFLKGNHHSAREQLKKGETGRYEKLLHQNKHKGHKGAAGHDSHGKHGKSNAATTHGGGKKHWIYHHGFPAKNAQLHVIDRREGFVPRYYN